MKGPLDVAFVWHMHQPYYKMSDTGAFEMPWVRMHAVKDYADMVDILGGHPGVRQTFNLVPSLVEQLRDYARGDYRDIYREHALRPAAELSPSERSFLLEVMCERVTHPRAIRNPRYLELAQKRDRCTTDGVVRVDEFSVGEMLDVQVWFDLAWFDARHARETGLTDLTARGRDFTEEDKARVAAAQTDLLSRVLPTYRRAAEDGTVELTTSPYFHPILPLLVNSDLARVSMPHVELPSRRFAHPEDAREHVRLAVAAHSRVFGRPPRGMWCSEQSVGEDVIGLLADEGIGWTISDETVLFRSLETLNREHHRGRPKDSHLYSAFRLEREEGALDIVFRDRELSDLLGFTYQQWDPADAAGDFLHRLRRIRDHLPEGGRGHLVTVALDGENAWEYYRAGGREFLERLYQALEAEPSLRCVTVSQHLAEHPAGRRLSWLHTGSWIGGDFGTWIGDAAHRRAWDLLHDARDAVAAARSATAAAGGDVEAAWREILIAEGSDWFWWFSDHQESGLDDLWDAAFRRRLQQAYRLAGLDPPADLFTPVLPGADGRGGLPGVGPAATVDGLPGPGAGWRRGIELRPAAGGTMQRSEPLPVDSLRFGWDDEGVHFSVESAAEAAGRVVVTFYLTTEPPPGAPPGTPHQNRAEAVLRTAADGEHAPGAADRPDASPLALSSLLGFRPSWRLVLELTPDPSAPPPPATDASGPPDSSTSPFVATASWERIPPPSPTQGAEASTDGASPTLVRAVSDDAAEATAPWTLLGTERPSRLHVGAVLERDGERIETFPSSGALDVRGALGRSAP